MEFSNIDKERAKHFRSKAIAVETLTNGLIGSQRENNCIETIEILIHYVLELTNQIDISE